MNPAGISYFYSAFDEATALSEVRVEGGTQVVISKWVTARELYIVDFTSLPDIPSDFDSRNTERRELTLFLYEFLMDFSQPVTKDDTVHIEYVPTQVVCEYIAQVFKTSSGVPIDGLLFPSSVARGGRNLVVFPNREKYRDKFDLVSFIGAEEKIV